MEAVPFWSLQLLENHVVWLEDLSGLSQNFEAPVN